MIRENVQMAEKIAELQSEKDEMRQVILSSGNKNMIRTVEVRVSTTSQLSVQTRTGTIVEQQIKSFN